MIDFLENPIPIAAWVDNIVEWLTENLAVFFSIIQSIGQFLMDIMSNGLSAVPPIVMMAVLTVAAYFIFKKRWQMPVFILVGLLFIYNQDMWSDLMYTLTLVILSSLISVAVGVPIGILMSKSNKTEAIIKPILDVMQTMPGFVYLIPAVAFFGIGMVPGVFASVIFAVPPTVRLTNLGIRQVDNELKEASDSFGGTNWQKLYKLEIPLAKGSIFAGINQTIMLSLSMVVISSMIGAPGLGQGVLAAVQRSEVGSGFVYGVGIVILAIIMDRLAQRMNQSSAEKVNEHVKTPKRQKQIMRLSIAAAVVVITTLGLMTSNRSARGSITLSYINLDTELASTNVIAQVLRDEGYEVNTIALDIPVMWEAVANGEADAMVGAWPATNKTQYDMFGDQMDKLGANLENSAQTGLVVPAYMEDVESIEDLTDQADQEIVGVEPGTGTSDATDETIDAYPNLSGWEQVNSSTAAMIAELDQAIKQEEPIVVSIFAPHWIFSRYDLTMLEDPKETMGVPENIETMAREGLEEDEPEAYQILDNFQWEIDDIQSVMFEIENGAEPEEAAQNWIEENPEKVESWTE
ncbi:ABC transporter permease/substrate binding protein [Tetragenococcus koreensis]|uniref:ABC transporter permease/substrate binding protein n=1 Tax=Tetragenococcus koreensis TaxID=290335 RepID=UPI001F3817CF|nr:ABC transporter permease/substrate binding protein [Tetragenococcus koreensis]MCF1618056.1 ABC transporter permease/substrate binding protein [Tetragenococcus koreensis]MCF1622918.1 ABC transporter permease/substrate binding protein [Tetragenococcus koreensis]MCF1627999.1 ABC transporter permease/substrate binding protein [Tetragenococcus koreensis]MCF1632824.1 ABC transporter permease/substrate binding protein [Tetragenococcus koreensis]MCF1678879.1 ABC transporter permease/substrate bindi